MCSLRMRKWQGRTFGAYTTGLQSHGQSFSLEFQREVAAVYEEQAVYRLPNWPLFLDCVMIYKRKSLEQLMAAQTPGNHGDDLLSSFFSGGHDPFAALGLLPDCADEEEEADEDVSSG